jgi:ABC-type branched-subunit amino acid transport system substrate-binding protein
VKIGLSAPFEGLYRDVGYRILEAVRQAVRERNESGGLGDRFSIELVALNDFNEPQEAVLQAREMRADPGILAALGGWLPETARLAGPEFRNMGIALASPSYDWELLGEKAAAVAVDGMGVRTAAMLRGPSPSDSAFAESFARAFAALGGSVVLELGPDARDSLDSDWDEGVNPAVLLVSADAPVAADWIMKVRAAGFQGEIIGGPQMGSQIVVDVAQEASDGAAFVTQLTKPADGSGAVAAAPATSGGSLPGPEGDWAYEATNHLLDAIEAAIDGKGLPTREGVLRLARPELLAPADASVFRITGNEVFGSFKP